MNTNSADSPRILIVKCPACGAPVRWEPENRWRPFCSKRCRTLDLGAWAAEQYRIPEAEAADGANNEDGLA